MAAYEMRISDWSSDVCSSDLGPQNRRLRGGAPWLTRSRTSRRSKTSAGCSNSCRPTTARRAGRRHYRLRPPTGTRRLPMNDHRSATPLLLKSAALTVALSAYTVRPDFVRPDMAVPHAFIQSPAATDATAGAATTADAEPAFWQAFVDPQLTPLVEPALAANPHTTTTPD